MKKSHLPFTVLLILAVVLTACLSTEPDISGEWKLVSHGDAANQTPALLGVDASIQFENGQLSGNVGCNSFSGAYELSGDQITIDGILSTLMYCEETSVQEQGVLGVFSDNVPLRIQLNGNNLTITSADGASAINLARK